MHLCLVFWPVKLVTGTDGEIKSMYPCLRIWFLVKSCNNLLYLLLGL